MTLFSIRTALVLCLAATLASCGGGGKATFVVGGYVDSLAYPGLVLQTGSQKLTVAPNVTAGVPARVTYAFPSTIEYGTVYNVTVFQSPAEQNCTAYFSSSDNSGVDSAGHTATINVPVLCETKQYTLGGAVTGLTGAGLQLINGSVDGPITIAAGATTFVFAGTVPVGTGYGISVLVQPAGQTCTVTNGTGTMVNALRDATTANPTTVTCVNNPT